MHEMSIDIRGLGLILYSPPAVDHIAQGEDYLETHFLQPADVARHVMDCQLTAFGTGTPGSFVLRFTDGPPDESAVEAAEFKIRLGLQVLRAVRARPVHQALVGRWRPRRRLRGQHLRAGPVVRAAGPVRR